MLESHLYLESHTPETYTIGLLLQALHKAVQEADRRLQEDEAAILANLRLIIECFSTAEKVQMRWTFQRLAWDSQWPGDVIGSVYREVSVRNGLTKSSWLTQWQGRFPEPEGLELLLCRWPRSREASDEIASRHGVSPTRLWEFVFESQELVGRYRT